MDIRELKATINTKIAEAKRELGEGNVEKATELKNEIVELKAELTGKEKELAEIEAINDLEEEVEEERAEDLEAEVDEESVENSEDYENKKEEDEEKRSLEGENKMANLNDIRKEEKNQEVRDGLNAFIRTKGQEKRDITSVEAGALIPEEILAMYEVPNTVVDLSKLVHNVKVKSGSGKYPVLQASNNVMASVAELAQNPKLADPSFLEVAYEIETYRAYVPVSEEAIADASQDLTAIVAKHIQKAVVNTKNKAIADVLKTFTAKTATSLDDVKKIFNVDLDTSYDAKIVATQSFFNALDTLKDNDGRYVLQYDVTSQSGYKLFGREVVIVKDTDLGTAGAQKAFIGDVNAGVLFADRNEATLRWADHDIYGQKLMGAVRFNAVKADANAGYFVTLNIPAPTAP